ncbi:alpha-(1,3)-fucosyltransferase C-like [Clytia hemisphaerica]|uniref:alpha-(1,3)-fucosyltransferase C-like n=1 Tax=Clytia hemisphaerica TaxID=252671 RepID=UPI0034D51C21
MINMMKLKAVFITLTTLFISLVVFYYNQSWLTINSTPTFPNPPRPYKKQNANKFRFLFYSCALYVNVTGTEFVLQSLAPLYSFCNDETKSVVYRKQITKYLLGWDVIIFYVHDMPGPKILRGARKEVPKTQLWAYYNRESPFNTINVLKKKFDGIFNLTMTPLRKSDIMLSYGYYRKKTRSDPNPNAELSLTGKNRSAVWIASHCNIARDSVVSGLLQYMPVTIYGKCARKFRQYEVCPRFSEKCEQKLRQFVFSLAFENSLCNDYVTEKYWDALQRWTIPVVYGGSNYDKKLVVPRSYINARNYNLRDLAAYLKKIFSDGSYLKYHQWRKDYVIDYKPKDRHRFEIVGQKLVDLLNRGIYSKTYKLSRFYNRKLNCEYDHRLNDLTRRQ